MTNHNDKLKVGIIGTGTISNEHIKAYQKNPRVELYALCDIDGDKVKRMGEMYGVQRVYTDMREMLAMEELDAVSVCTWNAAHAPCAIAALEAGKHVLCEKPMAISADQAKAMKRSAELAGKLLMIGFVRRFGNDCAIMQDYINSGRLGELYYAKAVNMRRYGNPGGWFSVKEMSGGGPLIDLGVHIIDLVRYLSGNPRPVSVYGSGFDKLRGRKLKDKVGYTSSSASEHEENVEDMAAVMIRFDNGLTLSVEISFSAHIREDYSRIQLLGSAGGIDLNPNVELYTDLDGRMANICLAQSSSLSFDGLFENEINHFVDCITQGTACLTPAQDGVALMEILDAAYRSMETGHEVIL